MKLPIVVVTRVSESMKHELRRAAEAEDRTVCAFIRLAIRDALARRAREGGNRQRASEVACAE